MQFDLVSLRLFASVVEHRNIAQAGRHNNIAASAISKRISELEARTGVPLLYRLREGVEPTPAGLALYRHAKRVAQAVADLQAELSEFSSGERGHVRLWANSSAVTQFLPEDLALYVGRYPSVQIDLREDTSRRIIDAVKDGLTDIGIFSDHVGEVDIETRVYRRDTLMLIVPAGHPAEQRREITLEQACAFDHVALQEGSSLRARILEEAARQELAVRIRVEVFGFDGIRRMVEAGLGVSILPQGAVLPYLGSGSICAIPLSESWASRSLLVGVRDVNALQRPCRMLLECLCPEE